MILNVTHGLADAAVQMHMNQQARHVPVTRFLFQYSEPSAGKLSSRLSTDVLEGCNLMYISVNILNNGTQRCQQLFLEARLTSRQSLKLAWEDAWNHRRKNLTDQWLSHRSVRP